MRDGDADRQSPDLRDRSADELTTLYDALGISAHDISNPLQTIGVLIELLTELIDEAHPARERFLQLANANDRLAELVKGLGNFVRSVPSPERPREPHMVLYPVKELLSRRFERHNIDWREENIAALAMAETTTSPLHADVLAFALGLVATAAHTPGVRYALIARASLSQDSVVLTLEAQALSSNGSHAHGIGDRQQEILGASSDGLDYTRALVSPSAVSFTFPNRIEQT